MSTTIRISRETKKELEALGRKGETFDDIVRKGAIELFNKSHTYITNLAVETPNGIEYIEIRVPKHIKEITSTNILGVNFEDTLGALCEEKGIKFENKNP